MYGPIRPILIGSIATAVIGKIKNGVVSSAHIFHCIRTPPLGIAMKHSDKESTMLWRALFVALAFEQQLCRSRLIRRTYPHPSQELPVSYVQPHFAHLYIRLFRQSSSRSDPHRSHLALLNIINRQAKIITCQKTSQKMTPWSLAEGIPNINTRDALTKTNSLQCSCRFGPMLTPSMSGL